MNSETNKAQKLTCRFCGKWITHFHGGLYHEIGAVVFPQYCANSDPEKASVMHSPITVSGVPITGEMMFIHRAAEAYEFIKMGHKETNPIVLDKSVRAWFKCNKLGSDASVFVDRAKELMVGTDVARAVCLLLIAAVDTNFDDGDLKFYSLKDLIAITQLVLFHKARVADCI